MYSSWHTKITSYYLNPVALCIYMAMTLLFAFSWRFLPGEDAYLAVTALMVVLTSAIASIYHFRRFLGIQEIPISTISAATQGYVELLGTTASLLPMKSPIYGAPCVWHRTWVYARTDQGLWQLADYKASHNTFALSDHTGTCEVNPEGAEVVAAIRRSHESNDHRYIEDILPVGKPVYVLGELDTLNQQPSERDLWREANQLAVSWKQHPIKLKARFDLNFDGIIDMQEWELARREAYHEVARKYDPHMPDKHTISRPQTEGRLYLISGVSPHVLRGRYCFWACLHFSVFVGAAAVSWWLGY